MRRVPRLLLVLALVPGAARGSSRENPGVTAAPILQIPMGSRALGMGGAFTPVASDVSALFYNPAGLSRLSAHEVSVTFVSGLTPDSNLQNLAYAGPVAFGGLSGNGYASAGASLLYSQNGRIEVNRANPDGSLLSRQIMNAGTDLVGSLAYSERVGMTPVDFKGGSYGINHYLGVSCKLIRSTLVERYSASAATADAGYLVHSPEAGVSFGFSALNVGGSLKYAETAEPLPTSLRSGLAYQGGVPSVHSLTAAVDGDWLTRERQWHVNAGVEYYWLKNYGLRVGYQFHRDAAGLTTGLGLRWRSQVLFDYAWAMASALGDSHRFTLTYRFGGVTQAARARAPRPFIEMGPLGAEPEDEGRGVLQKAPEIEPVVPRTPPRAPRGEPEQQGVPGWIY